MVELRIYQVQHMHYQVVDTEFYQEFLLHLDQINLLTKSIDFKISDLFDYVLVCTIIL